LQPFLAGLLPAFGKNTKHPALSLLPQLLCGEISCKAFEQGTFASVSASVKTGALTHREQGVMTEVPQRRHASPDEIAGAAPFLRDDAKAGFVTGQIPDVDGGFAAAGYPPVRA
jgi:NAD(P)-dependent dehydrogenase (short-subunit alcohol dehydrogenase family)